MTTSRGAFASRGAGAGGPLWLVPDAAYVHVPFCAHKCGYCDFASLANADDRIDRYLDALEIELSWLDQPSAVATVFVGGGTPTRLQPEALERLLTALRRWLPLRPGGEWTVEANPGTLDEAKVAVLVAAGVTRVSLGAQSFDRQALAVLERNHAPEEAVRALCLLRNQPLEWSLDLIFGVPGTTLESWDRDLQIALSLEPRHLSCYGLTYERGTLLWQQRRQGSVRPLAEEVERRQFEHTHATLAAAGLSAYEVSNFAAPGHECRHNLVYWANDAYWGFGLGAARYVNGTRSSNTRDLNAYLRRVERGEDPTGPTEHLDPRRRAAETAVLMLRRLGLGIDRADFLLRTGFELDALYRDELDRLARRGLVADDGQRVRLTPEGVLLADDVAVALL